MKSRFIFVLVLVIMGACSGENSDGRTVHAADSVMARDIALEKAIWNYYRSVEENVRKDLGVSEDKVVDRVQFLIDEGHVQKPVILVITEEGSKWASVDYPTYRDYMTSNAVISRRYYGTQPDILDSVLMDSIRSGLLEALKGDGLTAE